jgi:dihydropteroate synthase
MGIINVTPDSFSGDGLGKNVDAALAQAERFVQAGVDILDVGGESTRPGHEEVPIQEERDRVVPVVQRLVKEMPVPVSVDSYRLLVVQEALEAGAHMVNDVWGLRRTEGLGSLAAAYDVPIVLMHNRRADATRTRLGGHFQKVEYHDLMGEIVQELRESVDLALQSNVRWENVIVDPGIGFGKTPQQNLVVMRRLKELRSLGRPILMGTSRKSVIGLTLGVPMEERVEGTGATVAVSICNGADIVRVHDVKEMVRVSRMTDAIVR